MVTPSLLSCSSCRKFFALLLIAGTSAIFQDSSDGASHPTTAPSHVASKNDWAVAEKKELAGKAAGKVCKGGVVSSLDQYVDCETLVGFLSIVNSNEIDLSKLDKLKHFFNFEDQKHGIEVKYNTKMTHLKLSAKADVGKLVIVDNAKLADIEVSSSTTDVTISGNAKLTKIELNGDADGTVNISKNKVLKTATVKKTIKGGLVVSANPALTKVSSADITGATKEGDSLVIDGNDMLSDAPGLLNIKNLLIGAIKITNNKMLNNLDFLKNIRSIGTDKSGYSLTVRANAAMNNIMGITKVTGSLGSISIDRNPSLAVLSGFQDISEVKGDISVTSNKVLHDLLGFGKVQAVKGKLTIKHNDALTTIKCLRNTKQIGSEDISMNKNLKSISKAILAHKDSALDMSSTYSTSASEKRHTRYNGIGKSNICGGTTSDDWSSWALYGTSGLTQTVDTTKCGLTQKYPNYVSSMMGRSAHWQLTGVNSLNAIGQKSFSVKVWHPVLRGKFMMFFAKKYAWKLNWLADSGMNSAAKAGGWKLVKGAKNIVYNDVETTRCGFKSTPHYVTAIHGDRFQFETTGSHAIYKPSKDGFRVYLVVSDNLVSHHKDIVALADKENWRVAFVGSTDKVSSGKTSNDWKVYQQDGHALDFKKDTTTTAIYIDVDTSVGAYQTRPAYITSLSGAGHHWKVTGAGAIYQASATGFRIYLDNAVSIADAKKNNWRVNYVAYAGATNCLVSKWSAWSYCSRTCGGGFKIRARKIVKRAYFGGSCSYKLYAQEACSTKVCPVNCVVGPWTPKSKCSSTCGAAGVQERTRDIVKKAADGGAACPILSEALKCQPGPCAVHCKVAAWKDWTACPVSCGGKVSRLQVQ
jgi:hypothetical protein